MRQLSALEAIPTGWINILRNMDFLDQERARAYRNILLAIILLAATIWLITARSGVDITGKPLGTDFVSFWTASHLANTGNPANAYDMTLHHEAQRRLFGFDPGYYAFFYPPPYLLLCLPLAQLPYLLSLLLWVGTTGFAYFRVVMRWLGQNSAMGATIAAFPPVMINAGHGQNGFLTAALLGAGLILMEKRPALSGFLLGSLIIKPHLALLLPIALIARGTLRTFIFTGMTALGWCLAAYLILGMDAWQAFFHAAPFAQTTLERGLVDPAKMVSSFAAARVLGAPIAIAYTVQLAATLLAAAAIIVAARRKMSAAGQNAIVALATVCASPFLLDYDLTLLALPLAWLFSEGQRRGFRPWEKLLLLLCFIGPLGFRAIATNFGIPLAPPLLLALLCVCLRAEASDHRHAAVHM